MHLYLGLALWGVAAFAIFKAVEHVLYRRQLAAKAAEVGAKDAPMYPNCGFGGRHHLKLFQEADKNSLFPDMLVERERVMSELHGREVSTFKANVLFQNIFFTSDPKNVQAMLATQFPDYDLGPSRRGNMGQTLGDGIFVQDGKKWEHSRALLRPNFVREQVSDLDMEERHIANLLKVMPVQQDGWTAETDIQTLFFRFTIDSATEFLFGTTVDSQLSEAKMSSGKSQAQLDREHAFASSFDAAQRHLATRFRLGDLWWLSNPQHFKDDNKIINDFISDYVDIALRKSAAGEKIAEEGKGHYVFLEELARQTRDPVELSAQLLNILLAGRDTTASLLSWLFHQMLRNPAVFAKLRATITADFGTFDDPRNLTFSALKSCQYLQHCLNETLRLWTVVPGNARRSNKITTLPRGGGPDGESPIVIPAQTDVNYSVHVMHRRKDIWGPDAEEFKPERFAGRKPGWEFLPFNGGPRICIGQQFALTEASYVVVRLLQRFDAIEPGVHELEGVVRSNLGLTNCPQKPVTLRMREARE
jgi:cytochrome P450